MNILTCEDIRNLVDGCAKGVDELVQNAVICAERLPYTSLFEETSAYAPIISLTR